VNLRLTTYWVRYSVSFVSESKRQIKEEYNSEHKVKKALLAPFYLPQYYLKLKPLNLQFQPLAHFFVQIQYRYRALLRFHIVGFGQSLGGYLL